MRTRPAAAQKGSLMRGVLIFSTPSAPWSGRRHVFYGGKCTLEWPPAASIGRPLQELVDCALLESVPSKRQKKTPFSHPRAQSGLCTVKNVVLSAQDASGGRKMLFYARSAHIFQASGCLRYTALSKGPLGSRNHPTMYPVHDRCKSSHFEERNTKEMNKKYAWVKSEKI